MTRLPARSALFPYTTLFRAFRHPLDESAADLGKAVVVGILVGDGGDLDTEHRPAHLAEADQILHDPAGEVDRDREAIALIEAGAGRDRAVDPDDAAAEVDHRPARVSGIDDRVGLEEVLDCRDRASVEARIPAQPPVEELERAAERAHDAG